MSKLWQMGLHSNKQDKVFWFFLIENSKITLLFTTNLQEFCAYFKSVILTDVQIWKEKVEKLQNLLFWLFRKATHPPNDGYASSNRSRGQKTDKELYLLNLISSKGKILGSIKRWARHDQYTNKLHSQRFSNTSRIRITRIANTNEMARVYRAKGTTAKANRERTR